MKENFEEKLRPEEREAFNRLAREKHPPASLETTVIKTLKEEQLLRLSTTQNRRSTPRTVAWVAASMLIFLGGAVFGATWWTRSDSNAPKFMLVLRAGADSEPPRSSEEVKRTVEEYGNWARSLRDQGVHIEGEKLKEEARVLGEDRNQAASIGPQAGEQRRISGYFLIGAQDFDRAVQIASDCPHLKYGGTIEVRQIDRF